MSSIKQLLMFTVLSITALAAFASGNCSGCCNGMGGIRYCDSSAGRFVCNNGYYSSCYCTRHAVMDLQKIMGCCLWHGGVLRSDDGAGVVICRDGTISETCSLHTGTACIATSS